MDFPNIFQKEGSQGLVDRINNLSSESQAQWGKMNVAQMLKHCNVPYEMVYEPTKFRKPGGLAKLMIKLFAKNTVVGTKPYAKNGRTAPDFIVPAEQDFQEQKQALQSHIWNVQKEGEAAFDGKESHALGNLSANEWNTMFYKHLDHHLQQFGV
jgi:hypothetical protein